MQRRDWILGLFPPKKNRDNDDRTGSNNAHVIFICIPLFITMHDGTNVYVYREWMKMTDSFFSNLNQLIIFLPSSGLPGFCDVQMYTFFTVIPIFIVPHILDTHTLKITVYIFFRNDATIFNGMKRKDFLLEDWFRT